MAGANLRSDSNPAPQLDGSGMRLGVVCGRFNDVITLRLLEGVLRGAHSMRVERSDVTIEWVPGSFEVPFAAKQLAASGRFDAVICLGAVIRGETSHYDFVAGECARGIQDVQLETDVPVLSVVLTPMNFHDSQEHQRFFAEHFVVKGTEAARACMQTVATLQAARTLMQTHSGLSFQA